MLPEAERYVSNRHLRYYGRDIPSERIAEPCRLLSDGRSPFFIRATHICPLSATSMYAKKTRESISSFPPKGLLPLPNNSTRTARGCDLWDEIFDAAVVVNPAFNIYRIFDTVGSLYALPLP